MLREKIKNKNDKKIFSNNFYNLFCVLLLDTYFSFFNSISYMRQLHAIDDIFSLYPKKKKSTLRFMLLNHLTESLDN